MPAAPLSPWLQQSLDAVQAAPASLYVPAAMGLIAGLGLLLFGQRLLGPALILLGVAVGGLAGGVLLTNTFEGHTADCPAALAAMGVGAVVGGFLAGLFLRPAVAIVGAVSFAAVGALVTAAVMVSNDTPTSATTAARYVVRDGIAQVSHTFSPSPDFSSAAAVRATAKGQVELAASTVWNAWTSLPGDVQRSVVVVAMIAGVAGLLMGTLRAKRTAALLTALMGAGLVLACAVPIIVLFKLTGETPPRMSAMGWAITWGVVSLGGLVFQLVCARRPSPKA